MKHLVIQVMREAYSQPEIIGNPQSMTVEELMEVLREYNPEAKIILSHDNGYTYGGLYQENLTSMGEDNIYEANGFLDRNDYLNQLSHDYNVPLETIQALANMLGPEEDFDGLVGAIEEMDDED